MSDVKVFKLLNGQELMGRVVSRNDNGLGSIGVTLQQPHLVLIIPSEKGLSFTFQPYSIVSGDEEAFIPSRFIMSEMTPRKEFERSYLEQTTGLSLPPEPPLDSRVKLFEN